METEKSIADILKANSEKVELDFNRIRIIRELIASFGKSDKYEYKYEAFIDQILFDCIIYKLVFGDDVINDKYGFFLLRDIKEFMKALDDPNYECGYKYVPNFTKTIK